MSEVMVREATMDDVAGVAASSAALFAEDAAAREQLRNQGWPAEHGEQWAAELIADPHSLVLVAVLDDVCVGHLIGGYAEASAMWVGSRAELVSMCVAGSHRGDGVGSRLVAGFVDWARRRGASRLQVDAYTDNEGAVRFYERHGFEPLTTSLIIDL